MRLMPSGASVLQPMRVNEQAYGLIEGVAHGVDLDGPLGDGVLCSFGFVLDTRLFELELIERESVVAGSGLGFSGDTLERRVSLGSLPTCTGRLVQEVPADALTPARS